MRDKYISRPRHKKRRVVAYELKRKSAAGFIFLNDPSSYSIAKIKYKKDFLSSVGRTDIDIDPSGRNVYKLIGWNVLMEDDL